MTDDSSHSLARTLGAPIEWLGELVIRLVDTTGRLVIFALTALPWLFRRPIRWQLWLQQMDFVGFGSLFIIGLTGSFTGIVLSYQAKMLYAQFQAEGMIGLTVAITVTRELGPVLTGLMLCGRIGSSMATELGTMRVTEQIDALVTMAVNPIQYLVAPRILAATLMAPLLVAVFNILAVGGAYLMSVTFGDVSAGLFFDYIQSVMKMNDIWLGLIKGAVIGAMIATVACYKGYHASGGAKGVGDATTSSVVLSSVLVLALNYLLTVVLFR